MAKKRDNPFGKFERGPGKSKPKPEPEVVEQPKPEPEPIKASGPVTTLHSGTELPKVCVVEGADQLHVECLELFRKMQAGGMINPMCPWVNEDVDEMIMKLTKVVEGK